MFTKNTDDTVAVMIQVDINNITVISLRLLKLNKGSLEMTPTGGELTSSLSQLLGDFDLKS